MEELYTKTSLLIGDENTEKLKRSCVMVVGVGGVGGSSCEALVRSGIGSIIICDCDIVDPTNLNRQIISTEQNIGSPKTLEAQKRLQSINSELEVIAFQMMLDETSVEELFSKKRPDYVIDAIDSADSKIALYKYCIANDIPIISSMGTANRLDPTKLHITDIYKTQNCPFAKVMRKKCKDNRIKKLTVVCSDELPIVRNPKPAACMFVPTAAAMILSSYVVRKLIEK